MSLGGKSDYDLKEIHRKASIPFNGNGRTRDEAERELKKRGYSNEYGSWSKCEEEYVMTPKEAEEDRQASIFFMRIGLVIFCAYFLYELITKYIPELMSPDLVTQYKSQKIKYSYYQIFIWYGFTFISAIILFYKSSFMKFYSAFLAILYAFGWYGYHLVESGDLTNNMTITLLLIATAIVIVIPKINYYVKSAIIFLVPLLGIYITSIEFAMTWILMMTSGTLLLCRESKRRE